MKEIAYHEKAAQLLEILPKGAFLTTKADGRVNTMTIGWGTVGFAWGSPVFMALVRKSRFTYELLEKSSEFTVSFPTADAKAALGVCGSKSGRQTDKIETCGFNLLPCEKIDTPFLDIKGIHLACKVIYKNAMTPQTVEQAINQGCYPQGDYHTLYFGAISACYLNE